ncbi:MAG: hypothetical protein R3250_04650 [Melioribacteraceae bacterium]|nr:hypothetical protein [Melioribacteraceae bacterium]
MPTKLNLKYDNEILTAILTGEYSPDSAKENFTQILNAAAENKTEKVVIDTTGISEITTSLLNAFDYGKFVASEFLEHIKKGFTSIKFAYLYIPQNEDVLKFGETVAQNRGMRAKAFTDMNEAVKWLKEE